MLHSLSQWIHDLYDWTVSWAGSPYADPALLLLAFAESSFFPLPPDVLLMALTLGNPSGGMYYAMLTTIGSFLGGMFGYLVGKVGGKPFLLRVMGQERVSKIHDMFERYEGWAILIAGLTPVPYKVFTLGAGAFYVNFKVFVVASLIGRGARFFLVAGMLQFMGPWAKEMLEQYLGLLTVALVVCIGLGFWLVRLYEKKVIRPATSSSSDVQSP